MLGLPSFREYAHEARVRGLVAQVTAMQSNEGVPTFALRDREWISGRAAIDLRAFAEVLTVDPTAGVATVETSVSMRDLVRACLEHNMVPRVTTALERTTVGAAVAGFGVGASSFRYGAFHDACVEYELVSGQGDVLPIGRESDPTLFDMIHCSMGTFGVVTRARIELTPARPFVRLEHLAHTSLHEFVEQLTQRSNDVGCDFVEGIVHAEDASVSSVGRFADEAPYTSEFRWIEPYFKSTTSRREDYLNTEDFLFRFDADSHWMTKSMPGMLSPPIRFAFGRWVLGSTQLQEVSESWEPLLRWMHRHATRMEVLVPMRQLEDFLRGMLREVQHTPLWVVPVVMSEPYPWIARTHSARLSGERFAAVGVYGMRETETEKLTTVRRLALDTGGLVPLPFARCDQEDACWEIVDRAPYESLKRGLDPENKFGTLLARMQNTRFY